MQAILVVDDEELVRRVTCGMVTRLGYRAVPAEDGPRALAILEQEGGAEVAAAILDLTMPGMSGADTLRSIRKLRPDLPVIVTSGYSRSNALDTLAELGPIRFLAKPFQLAVLRQRIKEALG